MLIAEMGKRTQKDSPIIRFLQDKFEESGLSTSDIETLTDRHGPFRVSQGYAHQIVVDGTSVPSLEKTIGLSIALEFDFAEILSVLKVPPKFFCSSMESFNSGERQFLADYVKVLRAGNEDAINTVQGTIRMALGGGLTSKKAGAKS